MFKNMQQKTKLLEFTSFFTKMFVPVSLQSILFDHPDNFQPGTPMLFQDNRNIFFIMNHECTHYHVSCAFTSLNLIFL